MMCCPGLQVGCQVWGLQKGRANHLHAAAAAGLFPPIHLQLAALPICAGKERTALIRESLTAAVHHFICVQLEQACCTLPCEAPQLHLTSCNNLHQALLARADLIGARRVDAVHAASWTLH